MEDIQDLTCPFCGENEFDKIGLKIHLNKWCDEFAKTLLPKDVIDLSWFTKE